MQHGGLFISKKKLFMANNKIIIKQYFYLKKKCRYPFNKRKSSRLLVLLSFWREVKIKNRTLDEKKKSFSVTQYSNLDLLPGVDGYFS